MATLSTEQLCLVMMSVVWSVMWTVLVVHSTMLLLEYRSHFFMRARFSRKREIFFIAFNAAIYTLSRPLSLCSSMILQGQVNSTMSVTRIALLTTSIVSSAAPLNGLILVGLLRMWHSYFEANLAVFGGIHQWRCLVDERLKSQASLSWFIQAKDTWGNRGKTTRYAAIVWLTTVTLATLLPYAARVRVCVCVYQTVRFAVIYRDVCVCLRNPSLVFGIPNDVIFVLQVLVFVGLTCWIVWDFPDFKDEVYLRREEKIIVITVLYFGIVWLVTITLPGLFGWDWQKNESTLNLVFFARQANLTMLVPWLMYIVSSVVISYFVATSASLHCCNSMIEFPLRFETEDTVLNLHARRSNSPSLDGSSQRNYQHHRSHSSVASHATLSDVLAKNNAFRAFVQHLFNECSYENIMVFLECVQFRDAVMGAKMGHSSSIIMSKNGRISSMNGEDIMDSSLPKRKTHIRRMSSFAESLEAFVFCDDIEKTESSIVSAIKQNGSAQTIHDVAFELASKYLRTDSPYQVNLPFHVRSQVLKLIDHRSDDEMIALDHCVFDSVIQESVKLLKESLTRFVWTVAFAQLSLA